MKNSRAAAMQSRAAREVADMTMEIIERLERIEKKLDNLIGRQTGHLPDVPAQEKVKKG